MNRYIDAFYEINHLVGQFSNNNEEFHTRVVNVIKKTERLIQRDLEDMMQESTRAYIQEQYKHV